MDRPLLDITPDGEEILEEPETVQSKITSNLSRINVSQILQKQEHGDLAEEEENEQQKPPEEPSTQAMFNMKDRIYFAREEVQVTLDLLSRVTSATGGIRCDRTARGPMVDPSSQIASYHVKLAMQKENLLNISKRLRSASERISTVLDRESKFYQNIALEMRHQNWLMQSRLINGKRQLYVDYGLRNAGSNSRDACEGYFFDRSLPINNKDQALPMQIAHRSLKTTTVITKDANDERESQSLKWLRRRLKGSQGIDRRLLLGQVAAFESDLFHALTEEALARKVFNGRVVVASHAVEMIVAGISTKMMFGPLKEPNTAKENTTSTTKTTTSPLMSSEFLDFLLRQELRRFHRRRKNGNNWRTKQQCLEVIAQWISKLQLRKLVHRALSNIEIRGTRMRLVETVGKGSGGSTGLCWDLFAEQRKIAHLDLTETQELVAGIVGPGNMFKIHDFEVLIEMIKRGYLTQLDLLNNN
ncbi:hypothetical protein HDU76_008278 [Blyttiomyces sp. JEL0837]|nr:hypothetical protein HDU76_008278 [Blyttiomyces sp. JEL0837]